MELNVNQLGLAEINDESWLIHILAIQEKQITIRPYNSTTGRWLKKRDITREDIKHVFFYVGGKPQTLSAPKEEKRKAA